MRRDDILTKQEKELLLINQKRGYKYWIAFWKNLYKTVAIVSYLAMLVSVVFAFYYSIVDVQLLKAVPAYLIVLLLTYVNRTTPN